MLIILKVKNFTFIIFTKFIAIVLYFDIKRIKRTLIYKFIN